MKFDLIISGVGGQGIISIATVLGKAALAAGLNVKQSEIHGMAQRGGAVHSHLRLSSEAIASDVIPRCAANMILSVEPMEALRYLPYLASDGWVVSNETPFENIPNYPDVAAVRAEIDKLPHHLLFDADTLAKDLGSPRSMNMAMLGAASPFIELDEEFFKEAIADRFESKGEKVVAKNLEVFAAARALARERGIGAAQAGA